MDSSDVRARIARKCDDIKELVLEKNAAYGNAVLDPLRIFSRANPVEQIKVRLDDKLSRIARGRETSIKEDTPRDLTGYLILLMVAQDLEEERTLEQVRLRDTVDRLVPDAPKGCGSSACFTCFHGPQGSTNTCAECTMGDRWEAKPSAPRVMTMEESLSYEDHSYEDFCKQAATARKLAESNPALAPVAATLAEEAARLEAAIKNTGAEVTHLADEVCVTVANEEQGKEVTSAMYEAMANRAAALEQKVNPFLSNEPITCTVCNYTAGMTRMRCPNCNARHPVRMVDPAAPACFKCQRNPVTNPTNGLCGECARDEHVGCVVCGKVVPPGTKLCAACDPHPKETR